MAETLKKRSEIPENLKWDTSRIFKTKDDLKKALEVFKSLTEEIENTYKGKLTDAATINACMEKYNEWARQADLLYNYVSLNVSVDYTDAEAQKEQSIILSEFAKADSALSFIDSELADAPVELIEGAIKSATVGKCHLKDIEREKPHRLSPETEKAFASLRETIDAPYNIYETSKLADMSFPDFEVKGKKHPLGYSLFEDNYEYERDTDVRRAAFSAFSNKLRDYMYTTATVYGAHVRNEKIISELRKYDSVIDMLLFQQKVTREMYDRQIDIIMEKLAPHMRKYARLLKEAHGLDKMTYADLKITLDPDYDPHVTIEESKK